MPTKTIYVSQNDEPVFEEAQRISGDALSSVIVRALREYVTKFNDYQKGMKEIKIKVGSRGFEREQRFIGSKAGKWNGFSDDKDWWMEAEIFSTQKGNWAVHLKTVCKASLVTNPLTGWMNLAESMATQSSELIVGENSESFKDRIPSSLMKDLESVIKKFIVESEFLDI